jgi:hypothetical protein
MHAGQPALGTPLPEAIARASTALAFIEDLREPFVRGADAPSAGATAEWEHAYRTCVQELRGMLDMAVPQ